MRISDWSSDVCPSDLDSGVISRQIASVSLGLYASADYRARKGTPVVPAELSQHECLRSSTSKADSIWTLASGGKVEKIPVSGRRSINSGIMLQRMALQGAGIVPMSCMYAGCMIQQTSLIRVLPEWEFSPIPLLALFPRSEEHTYEIQSLMRISYAVFCLKK